MSKMLLSIPDQLATRFRASVPARQRSLFLVKILEKAIQHREEQLYQCAKRVEADQNLNQDLSAWDSTTGDGLDT